jgi:hypothetical protein
MWLFACNLDQSFQMQSSKLADFDMDLEKSMMQDVIIPSVELGTAELVKLLREFRASEEQANTVAERFQPELKVSVRAMHVAMMKV